MHATKKLSTNEILESLTQDKKINAKNIDFIEPTELRNELSIRILKSFKSMSQFAAACGIQASQLSEFLSGKKNFSRDRLMILCITLKMSIPETQDTLKRFEHPPLYPRNQRDFLILSGIQKQLSWQEIDDILMKKGMDRLPCK